MGSTERLEVAEEYMTRDQVAEMLQVSTKTVDRYIKNGKLTASRLPGGRLLRIPRTAVDALLQAAA